MGVKERREKEKENLRGEIFAAAADLFANEGYESVSMRKIAERIEYSPATIYLYFKDKKDLLRQICENTFAHLGNRLGTIEKRHGKTFTGLKRGLREYVEFGLEHPKQYEVTFMMPLDNYLDDAEYSYENSMGKRAFEYLREQVAVCMETGEIKRDDVDTVAQALWAGVHGVTSLLVAHCHFPFVERKRLIDKTIELLLDGLKT
jgi:AcrR family transcriptional regulator